MKKLLLFFVISIFTNSFIFSQSGYVDNALKFSTNDYGGTARFVGMGGAFGALGGDFSSIAVNPAGLGVYRSSELVFSPGLSYSSNSATYINNNVEEGQYAMNLNNLSFVASYDLENNDSRWVNFNFGVGFNRTSNFNDNLRYEDINNNSIMEVFVDYANNNANVPLDLDGMYEYLLFSAGVIDTAGTVFYSDITDEVINDPANFEIFQRKTIRNEGSVNEFSFSFGGNYAHKLYVGASLGITKLKYKQFASHYEYETENLPIYYTDGFDFREYSTTEGTGFTLKLGAIYKPIEFLRLGASLHLPTFYSLDEEFYNKAVGYYDTPNDYLPATSAVRNYEYELNTPLRAIGSVGFQIGKFGLVDVDYEFVDYSTMKLNDNYDEASGVVKDNSDIKEIFQETHNIRVGGEFRYGPLYFRAGGRYSTSPYKDVVGILNPDYTKTTYSGGLGYRENNFFIDFAYSQTISSYKQIAYDYEFNDAIAEINNKMNNFILTVGFKF